MSTPIDGQIGAQRPIPLPIDRISRALPAKLDRLSGAAATYHPGFGDVGEHGCRRTLLVVGGDPQVDVAVAAVGGDTQVTPDLAQVSGRVHDLALERPDHRTCDPVAGRAHDRVVEGPVLDGVRGGVLHEGVHRGDELCQLLDDGLVGLPGRDVGHVALEEPPGDHEIVQDVETAVLGDAGGEHQLVEHVPHHPWVHEGPGASAYVD